MGHGERRGPEILVSRHGVEDRQELSHAGRQSELLRPAAGAESFGESGARESGARSAKLRFTWPSVSDYLESHGWLRLIS